MLVVSVRAVEDSSLQILTKDDFLVTKNKPATRAQKNMGQDGEMRKDATSEEPSLRKNRNTLCLDTDVTRTPSCAE